MNYLSYHRPHFTFPKPIHDPQFDYVDEEEVTPEERPSRDAYAGDTEAGELGIGKKDFPLQTSPFTVLLLLFDKKRSFGLSGGVKWQLCYTNDRKKQLNFAISKAGEEVYPTESHKNKFR